MKFHHHCSRATRTLGAALSIVRPRQAEKRVRCRYNERMVQILTKAQDERRIFELLAATAGMSVVPNSIQQNDPPAPDIECQIQGLGPFAVELVALDAADTRARLQNMRATDHAWRQALAKWPAVEQARLRAEGEDLFLALRISNDAGARDRTQLMGSIQAQLLAKPSDFKGNLFDSLNRPRGLLEAIVHRGHVTNGPRINAPSAGSWLPPQIQKIEEKLTAKTYSTSAPLELFAYATHDDVDAHVRSLNLVDECVKTHLPGSQFLRVRVFNYWTRQLKYSYPS
jgi:hypothetical protein